MTTKTGSTGSTGSNLEHAIGADGLFSISLGSGEARLRAVSGGTVRIRDGRGQDLADLFELELGDGNAALRAMGDGRGRRGRGGSPDLEIELPARTTVVVESASGDVDVDGLLGDQRYRSSSGDLRLRAVSGKIAIEAVSGDVDVVAIGEAEVRMRTTSGDIELRAATIRELQATTTSGDVKIAGRLAGPGPFSIVTVSGDGQLAPAGDVTIEMASLSGDLHSDFPGKFEGGRGRRSLTVGTSGPRVDFRSMSGDLNVVRPEAVGHPELLPAAEPPGPVEPATAPQPPEPPIAPEPGAPAVNGAIAAAYEDARLRILRSLERGDIDVAEAGNRLEALDSGSDETMVEEGEPAGTAPDETTQPFDTNASGHEPADG